MIRGAPYWDDRARYHVQTDNSTEQQVKKLGVAAWLQTCGPTAAVNCLDALGAPLEFRGPGEYVPQPEEVLADYLNDPRNYEKLKRLKPDIASTPGNYWPFLYPLAVRECFAADAAYSEPREGFGFDLAATLIASGSALMLHLDKPAHYIAAVAYDYSAEEIIYHDSWPRATNGFDGFCNRMGRDEFVRNIRPFFVQFRR